MIINNQYVMTMQAGMNMKDKLVKLAKSQGFTDRNICIFCRKGKPRRKRFSLLCRGNKRNLECRRF